MDEEMHRPRKAARRVQLGRFVVFVDGQGKAGYPERNAADAAAEKIRRDFPRVSVTVTDVTSATTEEPAPQDAVGQEPAAQNPLSPK